MMERVLRRLVERARSAEWSREGFAGLENRRIPTGKRKVGRDSWGKRLMATNKNLTCPGAFGNDPSMSIPHMEKAKGNSSYEGFWGVCMEHFQIPDNFCTSS